METKHKHFSNIQAETHFLSRDDGFGVEQGSVGTIANFVTDGWFQINVDGTRNVLSGRSLAEKGIESVSGDTGGFVTGHHTIGPNAVFQAVQFPAAVTNLDTSLTEVDRDDFTHV